MSLVNRLLLAAACAAPLSAGAQQIVSASRYATTALGEPASAATLAIDDARTAYRIVNLAAGPTVVKTDASGAVVWQAAFAPPAGYTAGYVTGGLGRDGAPYVVAGLSATDPALPNLGYGVQRYDAATGAVLSTGTFWPAGCSWFRFVFAAPGNDGAVFLTGETNYSGNDDSVVAKIDAAGALAWETRVGHSTYDWDPRIAVDRAGNPVITAQTWWWNYVSSAGIYTMDPRLNLARLDKDTGVPLLDVVYEGIPGRDRMGTYAWGIAFDANDDIYVAGAMDTTYSGQNVLELWGFVTKFDGAGNVAWEWIDRSRTRWISFGQNVITDAAGNAYIAESFDASAAGRGLDCAVHRFGPAIGLAWTATVDGQESGDDTGCLLANDAGGGLYLAATSQFAGRSPDATVVRLDPATGAVLWRAASGSTLLDRPTVSPQLLAASPGGTLAVAATTAAGDLGLLFFGPSPSAASFVAPVASPVLAAAGKGSRNVVATLASASPYVSCNLSGGGDPFNRVNVKAGASGTFLFRPQVTATGYDATCFYEGPGDGAAVTATLTLKLEQGQNAVAIPLAFDATRTHQAVSNVIDAQLAQLKYASTTRLWVFDGVASRDPDAGPIVTYRWDVNEVGSTATTTLYGRGATYRFPAMRTYNVKLTVTDDDGRAASSSSTVVVK